MIRLVNFDLPVPEVVIRRLPIYARALANLRDEGISVVSSLDLGRRLGMTPAQIRKDLSYFGEFGKQGTGYDVRYLLAEIRHILGLERNWAMIVVGVGRLGHAIASYNGFEPQGFEIAGLFDADPGKVGQQVGHLKIAHLDDAPRLIRERNVQIAIVAVPAPQGQAVVDRLVDAGITAILNYAPVAVHVPDHVRVEQIDPIVGLQSMTYYLARQDRLPPGRAS
jgi:redox-sensing transcriptional repressor